MGCSGGAPHFWPSLVVNGHTTNYSGGASQAAPGDVIMLTARLGRGQVFVSVVDQTRKITRSLTVLVVRGGTVPSTETPGRSCIPPRASAYRRSTRSRSPAAPSTAVRSGTVAPLAATAGSLRWVPSRSPWGPSPPRLEDSATYFRHS